MAFGIYAAGDSGNVQIDDSFANHYFRYKATAVTTSQYAVSWGMSYVDVTISGCKAALLALRCPNAATAVLLSRSGTNWTYRFIASSGSAGTSSIGTVIDYYVFDINPNPSAETMGLRVFDDAGAVVYDSGYQALIVRDFQTGKGFFDHGESWTYESGKLFAVIPAVAGGSSTAVGDPGGGPQTQLWYSHLVKSTSTHAFTFYRPITRQVAPPYWISTYAAPSSWLVVDVTDY